MWESNRDFADLTRRGVWYAILYNLLAVITVVISVLKFGFNPLPSLQSMSDLVSFIALLAFIFSIWGELFMLFYHLFQQARQLQIEEARQQGLEQGLEQVRQRFDQVFAGDKDALEKRDMLFNGVTGTSQK